MKAWKKKDTEQIVKDFERKKDLNYSDDNRV